MDHLSGRCPESWTARRVYADSIESQSGDPEIIIIADVTIEGNLLVTENLTVDGTTTFNNDVLINADLHVTENLVVDGTTTFNNDVLVDANLHVTENLVVDGTTTLNGNVLTGANFDINGNLVVNGVVDFSNSLTIDDNLHVTETMLVTGTSTLEGNISVAGDLIVNGSLNTVNLHLPGTLQVDGESFLNGWVRSPGFRMGGTAGLALTLPWSQIVPVLTILDAPNNSEFALFMSGGGTPTNTSAPDCPHITSIDVQGPTNRSIVTVYNSTAYPFRLVTTPDTGNFVTFANMRSATGAGSSDAGSKSILWFPGQRCYFIRSQDSANEWLPLVDENWSFAYSVQNNAQVHTSPDAFVVNQAVTFTSSRYISPAPNNATNVQTVLSMNYSADLAFEDLSGVLTLDVDIPWPWLPGGGSSSWPIWAQLPWIDASRGPVPSVVPGTAVVCLEWDESDGDVGFLPGGSKAWFDIPTVGSPRGVLHLETSGSPPGAIVHIDFSMPVTINCANPLVIPS